MEAKIVIIPVESESSRQQRILKSISKIFDERAKSEVERRKVWVLEEEERRRRMGEERHPDAFKESAREAINEELLHKYNMVKTHVDEERERFRRMLPEVEDNALQRIVHEILTAETRVAEEKERAERVAEQENMKTGAVTMDQKKSEQHEAIQQQFMSFVHRKQLANAEEKERDRRIAQQDLEERVLSFNRVRESEASWIASIIGEEQERARRVAEDTAIEISEEVKREVERRQTWRAEEKERTRRILDDFADELANDLEREASLSEVLFVEERERQSRVSEQREHDSREPTKDELVQEDKKIQVEEEFMSVVHRKQAKEAEDMERTRRLLQDELDDRLKSEVDRRLTWIMEERERARRLMSDYALEYHLQLEREASRFEVQRLEEQERERRIRAEKTKAKDFTTQFTDAKERVQEEFMSVLDKVKTASLEEQERQRRVEEDSATIAKEQAETEVSSQLSRIWSRGVEEEERQRRISEELHRQLQESMDSELNRRKTWILEEEERQRRIAADKTNPVIQDLLKSRLGQVQQATKKV